MLQLPNNRVIINTHLLRECLNIVRDYSDAVNAGIISSGKKRTTKRQINELARSQTGTLIRGRRGGEAEWEGKDADEEKRWRAGRDEEEEDEEDEETMFGVTEMTTIYRQDFAGVHAERLLGSCAEALTPFQLSKGEVTGNGSSSSSASSTGSIASSAFSLRQYEEALIHLVDVCVSVVRCVSAVIVPMFSLPLNPVASRENPYARDNINGAPTRMIEATLSNVKAAIRLLYLVCTPALHGRKAKGVAVTLKRMLPLLLLKDATSVGMSGPPAHAIMVRNVCLDFVIGLSRIVRNNKFIDVRVDAEQRGDEDDKPRDNNSSQGSMEVGNKEATRGIEIEDGKGKVEENGDDDGLGDLVDNDTGAVSVKEALSVFIQHLCLRPQERAEPRRLATLAVAA